MSNRLHSFAIFTGWLRVASFDSTLYNRSRCLLPSAPQGLYDIIYGYNLHISLAIALAVAGC